QLAERAEGAGGDLPAARALAQLDLLGALEGGPRLVEEAEQEVVLGARRGVLHAVEDLLVGDRGGALGERALLHDVVDPSQEGVGGRLPVGQGGGRLFNGTT